MKTNLTARRIGFNYALFIEKHPEPFATLVKRNPEPFSLLMKEGTGDSHGILWSPDYLEYEQDLIGCVEVAIQKARGDLNEALVLPQILIAIRAGYDAWEGHIHLESEAEMWAESAALRAAENYLPHWLDTQMEDMMGLT